MGNKSVLLCSMPWGPVHQPSIGLGILKSIFNEHLIKCKVDYLAQDFLSIISPESYHSFAEIWALNDFLFSYVIDPVTTKRQIRLLRERVDEVWRAKPYFQNRFGDKEALIEEIVEFRQTLVPKWLRMHAERIVRKEYEFIGFTCMFDQTIPSVALAHEIKKLSSSSIIILGGYAVREPAGSMLVSALCPTINAVCISEGEETVSSMAKVIREGNLRQELQKIPGLVIEKNSEPFSTRTPRNWNMDDIPEPDFDDFFKSADALKQNHQIEINTKSIMLENSRGCWWGQKRHCVFCGIKDTDLIYRKKSPENALKSIHKVIKKYEIEEIRFSDYILPNSYYKDFIPALRQQFQSIKFSGEIKANVTKSKIRSLIDAGFTNVQPGIESFSTQILKIMDKGVSGCSNIYLLRVAKELGLRIDYNFIFGLPGEPIEAYENIVNQVENLVHLDPPDGILPVQITRSAPLQVNPQRFGMHRSSADRSYEMIFSDDFKLQKKFKLNDFCYVFERDVPTSPRLNRVHRRLIEKLSAWRHSGHTTRNLEFGILDGREVVFDTRFKDERLIDLNWNDKIILRELAKVCTIQRVFAKFSSILQEKDIINTIEKALLNGLIYKDQDELISLILNYDSSEKKQSEQHCILDARDGV